MDALLRIRDIGVFESDIIKGCDLMNRDELLEYARQRLAQLPKELQTQVLLSSSDALIDALVQS
jgi:hypothetical protein